MKATAWIFLPFLLLLACTSLPYETPPVEEQLLVRFKTDPAVQEFVKTYPQAYISREYFCKERDCSEMVEQAGIKVPVYSKEESFMRALRQTILIRRLEADAQVPSLEYQFRIENEIVGSGTITL
jgi:replicative superfamily II helicase